MRSDFDEFAAREVEGLLQTAFLISGDDREAEDLVQECFYRIARRWPRVRRMEHPRAYARRILINLVIDEARDRVRRQTELQADDSEVRAVAASGAEVDDDRLDLLAALAGLPARERAVLVLRFFNDLTEADTAIVLGCSLGTVKSRTSRGLARLRSVLKENQPATQRGENYEQ